MFTSFNGTEEFETCRQAGTQSWLEEQISRWNCPNCCAKFSCYDKHCKKCGSKLYDCEDEGEDIAEG